MEESNSIIIVIFIFMLVILGLIIWIIIIMLPKNNVQLFGKCTHQLDCASGLVCATNPTNTTTTVCLSGLEQSCNTDTECADALVCLENQDKVKVCTVKPPTLNLISNISDLQFEIQSNAQFNTLHPQQQFVNQNRIQLSPLNKLTRFF